MSSPGMGVMIRQLFGDGGKTAEAVKSAIAYLDSLALRQKILTLRGRSASISEIDIAALAYCPGSTILNCMKTVVAATGTETTAKRGRKAHDWTLVLECGHTVERKLVGGTHWIAPGPKVKCDCEK